MGDLMRFFGVLKEKDWTKAEEEMKKLRKDFDAR